MSRTSDRWATRRRGDDAARGRKPLNPLARLRPRRGEDEGFTLVEVLVSLLLFALVASAAASMLVTGLRASLVAKLDTGAKNLAQERIEIMRNLPFHIDHDPAVPAGADNDDLISIYYRNRVAASGTTAPGYVGSTAARAAYEPPNGAFYRYVIDPVPGFDRYRQYVATQFIDEHRSPLSPNSTYDTQVAGLDLPPSQIVSVTVTTFWRAGTLEKSFQIQTYIAAGRPAAAQTTFQGRATNLRISGGLDATRLLTLQTASLSVDGSTTSGTTATTEAHAATGDITASEHFEGATMSAFAPPNISSVSKNENNRVLVDSVGVQRLYVGNTNVNNLSAYVTGGLPAVGYTASTPPSAQPVVSQVSAHGPGVDVIKFRNDPDLSDHLLVDETKPVAWLVQGANSVPVSRSTGIGRVNTGSTRNVVSTVTSTTNGLLLRLFPTSYAPGGVVQIALNSSSLSCTASSTGSSSSLSYNATVSYWQHGVGYVTATPTQAQVNDPLASVDLANTVVHSDGVNKPLVLGDYIQSWSSLTAGQVAAGSVVDPDNRQVSAKYDGLVNITTKPVRGTDALSAVSVQLGLLSCVAEDNR